MTELFQLSERSKFRDHLGQVRTRIFRKNAENYDSFVPDEDRATDQGITIQLGVAPEPKVLTVRVAITETGEDWTVMADTAIEYRWHSPVRYGPAALQDFVEFEGIPRTLTTSAAIMADAALAIGRKIQNPSLIAESNLIEQFRESFTFTDESLNASGEDDENENEYI